MAGTGGVGRRAHTLSLPDGSRLPFLAGLFTVMLLALALRLLALPPALPELDAANFARALTRFDLAAQAPHAPGYPLFVALSRLGAALGAPTLLALSLPGLLLGPLSGLMLGLALRRRVGEAGALVSAAIVGLAPLPVLAGATPTSDGAAFSALALATAALVGLRSRGALLAALGAGVALGLVLGLRPSLLPAVLPLLWLSPRARLAPVLAGLAGSSALLLIGLALAAGPAEVLRVVPGFLIGHTTEWGGTALVTGSLVERAAALLHAAGVVGLGLPALDAPDVARLVVALALAALVPALVGARRERLVLTAVATLAAWGLFAVALQNVAKARHALPLLLPVALLAGVATRRLARVAPFVPRPALAGALAAGLVLATLPVALEQGRAPSPAASFASHVAARLPATGAQYFTGDEGRLLTFHAPWYRAGRAPAAELPRHARALAARGVEVYVTSAAPGVDELQGELEPLVQFSQSPLVRTHGHTLTLYRLRAPRLAALGEP